MIFRITKFDKKILSLYIQILKNLEKKLFPEEQNAIFIQKKDIKTLCGFADKSSRKNQNSIVKKGQ